MAVAAGAKEEEEKEEEGDALLLGNKVAMGRMGAQVLTHRPWPLQAEKRWVMLLPWHELTSQATPSRPGGHVQLPSRH